MNTFVKKVIVWGYGLLGAIIGGAGTALSAFLGGKIFGAVDFTPRQMIVVAVAGAVFTASAYLKSSPLPAITESDL